MKTKKKKHKNKNKKYARIYCVNFWSRRNSVTLKRIEPKIPWRCHLVAIGLFTSHAAVENTKKINAVYCKHKINKLKIFLIHYKVFFSFHLNTCSHCTCRFHIKCLATPLQRRLRNSWQLRPNSPQFCFSLVCCSLLLLFVSVCVYALLHRHVCVIFSGQQIGFPPRNDLLLRAYGS